MRCMLKLFDCDWFTVDVTRRPVTLSLKGDMAVESIGKRLSLSDDFTDRQVLQRFWLSLCAVNSFVFDQVTTDLSARTDEQLCSCYCYASKDVCFHL